MNSVFRVRYSNECFIDLQCEVVFKQTDADGKSNFMGTISNLKLTSCIYDPSVRESSAAEVRAFN